jgi:hypothetical protein
MFSVTKSSCLSSAVKHTLLLNGINLAFLVQWSYHGLSVHHDYIAKIEVEVFPVFSNLGGI